MIFSSGRVDPSVEMNNLPSNQNTNEIDVHGIPEVNHHLTLIEAPLIFQDESSDNTVRLHILTLL